MVHGLILNKGGCNRIVATDTATTIFWVKNIELLYG